MPSDTQTTEIMQIYEQLLVLKLALGKFEETACAGEPTFQLRGMQQLLNTVVDRVDNLAASETTEV